MFRCLKIRKSPYTSSIRLLSSQIWSPMIVQPAPHTRRKRVFQDGGRPKRQKIRSETKETISWPEGSHEEVLIKDVRALFAAQTLNENNQDKQEKSSPKPDLPEPFTEIELKVLEISSTGDGLAVSPSSDQIYVVPFTAPGDKVRAKVVRHSYDDHYTITDFIEVIESSPLRDNDRIRCQYFGKCGGCQFQMLDYAEQLKHKRSIVDKAYKNFSGLSPALVPPIEDTMGSPLQYGYRTKLTPHFDGPRISRAERRSGIKKVMEEVPPIGFMEKGRRVTMDIEDCPIGTDVVRLGMKRERKKVAEEFGKYNRGVTLLLRESTKRIPKTQENGNTTDDIPSDVIAVPSESYTDLKSCITDHHTTTTEYVDSYVFTNPAGSFFQNNNSILPPFTQYIRDVVLSPGITAKEVPKFNYLVDAYSGSGLFTITLSSIFKSSIGIDIDGPSITFANKNAAINNLSPSQASFIAADANELFKSVKFPPEETVVVIDPPRKGCSQSFLHQLLAFAPNRVVYVSCNVHTQARDVGVLVNGRDGVQYTIRSLRGFDFFPQTGHVEGVAVLDRVDGLAKVAENLNEA